ncbi:MAG: prolyl-tRNA synthetase associated domain-containing protein [Bacteroidales bacterium]|nr:prolyl-tRNA synthetase associated domain-containing protein [Bacteroidales bacterium]
MAFFVSEKKITPPSTYLTETQRHIYERLQCLGIPFERVDTDDGSTMEDCVFISQGLACPVVKTIFLCNRQQTRFYLFVTTADKPFVTRVFCGALSVPRVSFVPSEMLWEKLGTRVGATTLLSIFNDSTDDIMVVMDEEVAEREYYACTDGTSTCFIKISMADLLQKYLPDTGHALHTIKL